MAVALRARRVKLRVANVPWLEAYHGREAGLVGAVVDAVELDQAGHVAYVDDRDGEASEYVECLERVTDPDSAVARRAEAELQQHATRRLLHGEVMGVRAA